MAAHRYPIRKGKYEALSKKELAMAIEIDNADESTDEEYKEFEKRLKEDQKMDEFLGEDDGIDKEFIPSKNSNHPDLDDCSDSETSSDAEEGNFDIKKRRKKYQKKPSKVKFLKSAKNSEKNPELIYCSGSDAEERNLNKYQSKIRYSKSASTMNSFHNEKASISKSIEEQDMFDDDSDTPNIEEISATTSQNSKTYNHPDLIYCSASETEAGNFNNNKRKSHYQKKQSKIHSPESANPEKTLQKDSVRHLSKNKSAEPLPVFEVSLDGSDDQPDEIPDIDNSPEQIPVNSVNIANIFTKGKSKSNVIKKPRKNAAKKKPITKQKPLANNINKSIDILINKQKEKTQINSESIPKDKSNVDIQNTSATK